MTIAKEHLQEHNKSKLHFPDNQSLIFAETIGMQNAGQQKIIFLNDLSRNWKKHLAEHLLIVTK